MEERAIEDATIGIALQRHQHNETSSCSLYTSFLRFYVDTEKSEMGKNEKQAYRDTIIILAILAKYKLINFCWNLNKLHTMSPS